MHITLGGLPELAASLTCPHTLFLTLQMAQALEVGWLNAAPEYSLHRFASSKQ